MSPPLHSEKSLPEKSWTSWITPVFEVTKRLVPLVAFWLLVAQMCRCVLSKSDARALCPWTPHFSRILCLNLLFVKRLIVIHSMNCGIEFTQWSKWNGWSLCVRFPEVWLHQSSETSGHLFYKLRRYWSRWRGFLRVLRGPSYHCFVGLEPSQPCAPLPTSSLASIEQHLQCGFSSFSGHRSHLRKSRNSHFLTLSEDEGGVRSPQVWPAQNYPWIHQISHSSSVFQNHPAAHFRQQLSQEIISIWAALSFMKHLCTH